MGGAHYDAKILYNAMKVSKLCFVINILYSVIIHKTLRMFMIKLYISGKHYFLF